MASGATVVVSTTGNGTTIGNAIAPGDKAGICNNRVFERMANDLDISVGNVIEGKREHLSGGHSPVFLYLPRCKCGIQVKAEILKHREFQFWAEQTVSL